MEILAPKLLIYGPLGVFCLALIYAVVYLARENKRLYEALLTEAKAHGVKATNWADKGLLLGEKFARALRRERRMTEKQPDEET